MAVHVGALRPFVGPGAAGAVVAPAKSITIGPSGRSVLETRDWRVRMMP